MCNEDSGTLFGATPQSAAQSNHSAAAAPTLRRCASTPTLRTPFQRTDPNGLEVYVLCRPFSEFGGPLFHGLPPGGKEVLTKVGICHFVTAFRTSDGRLHAFDFGPKGGDIDLGVPRLDQHQSPSFAWLRPGFGLGGASAGGDQRRRGRGTEGEIREECLSALPAECLYVGRTHLTLSEIREYNSLQNAIYQLNENDCRHYANNLVAYTTGLQGASSSLTTHALAASRGGKPASWNDHLLRAAQNVTDVRNWPAVKTAGHATLTVAALLFGHAGLARVIPSVATPTVASTALSPSRWFARPVGSAAVAAAATAATSFSEAPVIRETLLLGSRINESVRSVGSLVGAASRSASRGVSSTATATLSALSYATTTTRGAAALASRVVSGATFRSSRAAGTMQASTASSSSRISLPRPSSYRTLTARQSGGSQVALSVQIREPTVSL